MLCLEKQYDYIFYIVKSIALKSLPINTELIMMMNFIASLTWTQNLPKIIFNFVCIYCS